jgi:hypothetical protein
LLAAASSVAQVKFVTGHSDNVRSGANTNETLLAPGNVNKNTFGRLFNYSIEYQALAQPLYMPNVNIPGKGTHNVVYVATMSDAVYAFDADDNTGTNSSPLWYVSFLDPNIYGPNISTAQTATGTLPCTSGETKGPGFTQEGIVGTPVIDANSGTIYMVAKTVENGAVRHRLHALDITNGQEKLGGPVIITATSISNKGKHVTFNSLHAKNRPGLLLQNGAVYMAFGSNSCNDSSYPWVLAYDANTLAQTASFNASPDSGLASIWQSGNPITGDADGNVYAVTAESANYDVPNGGQSYSHTVLKLSPSLQLLDYFTPSNVAFMNDHDLDLSSSGAVVLPDQNVVIAGGKQGTLYVLDRNNLGMYGPNDTQIVQELPAATGALFETPAYWNGKLYYAANGDHVKAFSVDPQSGQLSLAMSSSQTLSGAHSPSISANNNTNGIVWAITGQLWAFDASNLKLLYNTTQNSTRDRLPSISHFITQTVANGRVYVATRTTLEVYGILHTLAVTSGANQTGQVLTQLPNSIQIKAENPYTRVGISGVTITFSDGGKGGTFSPASAVSDEDGFVSTHYTFPKTAAVYTLSASAPNFGSLSFTETATPGPVSKMISYRGNNQTGTVGSTLPTNLIAKVQDANGNGIAGYTVTFDDGGKGGAFDQNVRVTDANGQASVRYTLPPTAGKYTVHAVPSGCCKTVNFTETATIVTGSQMNKVSGDNQTVAAGQALGQPLVVQIKDQNGNGVAGLPVVFNSAAGTVNGSPATTDLNGNASVTYTAGTTAPQTAFVSAVYNALNASFTVNVVPGAASVVVITGGNGQSAPSGTQLPQALTVMVTDQYNNPVSGIQVTFSDGGAGGLFSNANPVTTDNTGSASQLYTLPQRLGPVNVSATAAGVNNPANFSETGQ